MDKAQLWYRMRGLEQMEARFGKDTSASSLQSDLPYKKKFAFLKLVLAKEYVYLNYRRNFQTLCSMALIIQKQPLCLA
jgi:hypothetical protein